MRGGHVAVMTVMAIEIRTRDDFETFMKLARHGDKGIYHRGYLASDMAGRAALRDLNVAIHAALKNDLIELVQRRLESFDYEYQVIRK
jgi:hypothetical protein